MVAGGNVRATTPAHPGGRSKHLAEKAIAGSPLTGLSRPVGRGSCLALPLPEILSGTDENQEQVMRYRAFRARAPGARSPLRAAGLTLGLTLSILGPAAAQDLRPDVDVDGPWLTIDRVELGAVELDTAQVVEVAPDVYTVRTRWRFAHVQTSPEGYRYRSSVAVRGIDCRRRQMAIIAFADHDGKRVVRTEAQPFYAARWDRVTPESIVDRIASHVCEHEGDGGAVASSAGG